MSNCSASSARAIVPGESRCPLRLNLSPQTEATIPGAFWSKSFTEREAIDEKHLPTLVQLLTQDNSRLVDRDRVFALFMDLANTPEELSAVARKSSTLNASQFDELIKRILATPGCGNEAVAVLSKVNRLTEEHRRELRVKVFREASLSLVANNAAALRISDAEVAQLALRMRAASELTPDVAVLALEKLGERLPIDAQDAAIVSIVKAKAVARPCRARACEFLEQVARAAAGKGRFRGQPRRLRSRALVPGSVGRFAYTDRDALPEFQYQVPPTPVPASNTRTRIPSSRSW